jgi:hypothetical protein
MFTVKREQRQKMGEPAFVDRTVAFFRHNYLEHVYMLDDEELYRRVVHGIAKARSYRLTWESSITTFVAHMLTINPEFDKQRVIHRVLMGQTAESIPYNVRLSAMLGLVSDDDWEEAAALGDPDEYWARVRLRTESGGEAGED